MKATLVEITKAMEENISLSSRDEVIKPLFEAVAAQNSVVDDVLNGKTTFSQQYEKLFGFYNSWTICTTPAPNSKELRERIAGLESCIGYSGLESKRDIREGLVAVPAVGYLALLPTYDERKNHTYKLDRRKFIDSLLVGVCAGSAFALIGAVSLYKILARLDQMKQNAEYLDNVYVRVFKNK